ncbi:MAG: biopolymer transporter ExbD, partial [Pseudomonadota bacterium]
LSDSIKMAVEPELQFEPDALASYDRSAKVLQIIKQSGVTKFGFVGSEKYRVFGKEEG